MLLNINLFIWLTLLAYTIAAPMTVLKPSEDDFYSAPEGFEDQELGTILKWRKTPYQIKSIYFPVNIKNSWQLLVRSEDAIGDPVAVTATIFEPYNGNSSRLISYQVAEDSASFDCSPSYSFVGGGYHTVVAKAEMILIQTALNQGYYVVAPDYQGPNSAFTAGITSGMSTINVLRAVLGDQRRNETNIDPDAEVVLWGYSGGTIPSGWAASMAPWYAKDVNKHFKGAALGGWVTNITATAEIVEGSLFEGLVSAAINGLSQQYEEIADAVEEYLHPEKYDQFVAGRNECLIDVIFSFAYQSAFTGSNAYAQGGWGILEDPDVKEILEQNTLGLNVTEKFKPEIPLFVYHGIRDEVVPFKDAQRVYDIWCEQGIESFEFAVSNTTGHILEVIEGSGAAMQWITERFEGKPPTKGCHRQARLTNLFYPGSFSGVSDLLSALIRNIMGSPIGLYDEEVGKRSVVSEEEMILKRLFEYTDEEIFKRIIENNYPDVAQKFNL